MTETDIVVVEALLGSDFYRRSLVLREAILRRPLGLTLSEEELADDFIRHHFCALSLGVVVGTVSLRPLDEATLQLKQMAVAEDRRGERIGTQLLLHAEGWAAAEASSSWSSMRGSAPRASMRGSGMLPRAIRLTRTRSRISK